MFSFTSGATNPFWGLASSVVERTLGDGGCAGRPWWRRDCAAYRWRGAAGMRAEDEMPASRLAHTDM